MKLFVKVFVKGILTLVPDDLTTDFMFNVHTLLLQMVHSSTCFLHLCGMENIGDRVENQLASSGAFGGQRLINWYDITFGFMIEVTS